MKIAIRHHDSKYQQVMSNSNLSGVLSLDQLEMSDVHSDSPQANQLFHHGCSALLIKQIDSLENVFTSHVRNFHEKSAWFAKNRQFSSAVIVLAHANVLTLLVLCYVGVKHFTFGKSPAKKRLL